MDNILQNLWHLHLNRTKKVLLLNLRTLNICRTPEGYKEEDPMPTLEYLRKLMHPHPKKYGSRVYCGCGKNEATLTV